MIFEDFLVEQNALIFWMRENRHLTLNFSQTYSICTAYFNLQELVDQLSGLTVLNFCFDQGQTAFGIKVMVVYFFCVTLYEVKIGNKCVKL